MVMGPVSPQQQMRLVPGLQLWLIGHSAEPQQNYFSHLVYKIYMGMLTNFEGWKRILQNLSEKWESIYLLKKDWLYTDQEFKIWSFHRVGLHSSIYFVCYFVFTTILG